MQEHQLEHDLVPINYDLVFAELKKGLRSHNHPVVTSLYSITDASTFYREFRTVAFTTPRQTGAKMWAVEQIKKDANAVLVFASQSLALLTREYHLKDHEDRVFSEVEFATAFRSRTLKTYGTYYFFDAAVMSGHTFHSFHCYLHEDGQKEPLIVRIK